ncbi:hypothetical protein KCU85_g2781, partial [Aureobasidium melanogenum]
MSTNAEDSYAGYVEPAWGWVIYRTVYTPESDRLWPQAKKAINTYMAHSLLQTLIDSRAEKDYEGLLAVLENLWMDDASQFDQATFEDLRVHFATWLQTQDTDDEEGDKLLPCVRFHTFLVIDETNLQSIAEAADPNDEASDIRAVMGPRIKVISAQRDARRLPEARSRRGPHNNEFGKMFPGWLNCQIVYLRELWEKVFEYRMLYEICPNVFEGDALWEP